MPRIVPGETFGSWFGRIAARYRLDVDVLAQSADLELALGSNCRRWVAAQPPAGSQATKLSRLTRVNREDIEQLREPEAGPSLWYCFACLVLNPADVFSPYWQRRWLVPGWPGCQLHPGEADCLTELQLSKCKNIRKLLDYVGRRRAMSAYRRRL